MWSLISLYILLLTQGFNDEEGTTSPFQKGPHARKNKAGRKLEWGGAHTYGMKPFALLSQGSSFIMPYWIDNPMPGNWLTGQCSLEKEPGWSQAENKAVAFSLRPLDSPLFSLKHSLHHSSLEIRKVTQPLGNHILLWPPLAWPSPLLGEGFPELAESCRSECLLRPGPLQLQLVTP